MFVLVLVLTLMLVPAMAPAEPGGNAAKGKEIYLERCVLCHGPKGHGWDWDKKVARPPVPVPNLVEVVPKRSDVYLMTAIRDGGEAVGLTRFMPAFGFNMNERELKDVVAYLRSLQRSAE
ncbi:MAG: c-type cytochrome [Candidatus Binatia bacterium]